MNPDEHRCEAWVSVAGMRAMETQAIQSGAGEASLMQEAGVCLGHAIGRYFPNPGTAVAWLGKGHNAGDCLIALSVLHETYGWRIRIRDCFSVEALAPLARSHRLAHASTASLDLHDPEMASPLLILDGLLGIGADGMPLRGEVATAAGEINRLRQIRGAMVAAIDVPSGIHPDTGDFPENAVRADVTFTVGAIKYGLMLPEAANCVGSLRLVPTPRLHPPERPQTHAKPRHRLMCPQLLPLPHQRRPYDFHKGMAGRVSVLAGSLHFTGAAALCTSGAITAGAGLVTLHVPRSIHALAVSQCAPEVIVKGFDDLDELVGEKADAWVIGCGIGSDFSDSLIPFIESLGSIPTVLDADALNILASHQEFQVLRPNHVITPHPGEFRRLAPDLSVLSPLDAVEQWTQRSQATLLLKGCRSVIGCGNQDILVNSTGNPGMATAGMGDVLAGVVGACLAIGHSPRDAAAYAAWLCGRAAERAIYHASESSETLRASHVIRHLNGAFSDWKSHQR